MKIKIERSGGIAGMPQYTELDSENLPPSLVTKIKDIIKDSNSKKIPMKAAPRGTADHYCYKFIFREGKLDRKIEFNQYNLHDDLKLLLKYVNKRFRYDK